MLESARKELGDRITAELSLAENRRNTQLTQLQEKFKEHVSRIWLDLPHNNTYNKITWSTLQ